MYIQVFNKRFLEFYDYLKDCKGTLSELLKVRVTEHDVISHIHSMVCYTTDRNQYNQIYNYLTIIFHD